MKRLLILSALLATAFLATGCIQVKWDSVIEKDGSGTMDMTMSLSKVLTESMDDLKALNQDDSMDGLDELMSADKDELQKKLKPYGVKITKFEDKMVDGRKTMEIGYEFKDLEGLSQAMNAMGTGSDDEGLAVFDNGDGTYTLGTYDYGWPAPAEEEEEEEEAANPMDEMDPEMMGKQMEIMGKLMGAMSELDVRMTLTVPGDIVETNAPEQDGRTSIWSINASNMMSMDQDMTPRITFKASGLKMKTIKE